MLSESHRSCAQTEREVCGAAGGDELEPAVAAARQATRSTPDVSRDLRLVHRGVWHQGPARGQGATGRIVGEPVMNILAVLTQIREVLQQQGRLSYRIMQRQFALDEAALEDLKFELIDIQEVAGDKDGKMLVWKGESVAAGPVTSPLPPSLSPASYTPAHLAERIRAEQSAMEARGGTDGERKTITALFADIQDSTALIEDLDPE